MDSKNKQNESPASPSNQQAGVVKSSQSNPPKAPQQSFNPQGRSKSSLDPRQFLPGGEEYQRLRQEASSGNPRSDPADEWIHKWQQGFDRKEEDEGSNDKRA